MNTPCADPTPAQPHIPREVKSSRPFLASFRVALLPVLAIPAWAFIGGEEVGGWLWWVVVVGNSEKRTQGEKSKA